MKRFSIRTPASGERGMAALVVVTVLFIVTSLVAAYTSRNLVFEQRTSANQYRSTQALEAAEAGIEWALAMLNRGAITDSCEGSDDSTDISFRTRYLAIDATTGLITPRTRTPVSPSPVGQALWPSCSLNGNAWTCSCPVNGAPVLDAPTSTNVVPAFRVQFEAVATKPGLVRIVSNGCTRVADACLNFPAVGSDNEGRAMVTVMAALTGGLSNKPAAALTVRGNLSDAITLTASNADVASGGITIQASGTANPAAAGRVLTSTPGTPGTLSILQNDSSLPANVVLAALSPAHKWGLFTNTFNAWPLSYRQLPATLIVKCKDDPCTAQRISDIALLNPGRPLWLEGSLLLDDTTVTIGSAGAPVLLIVAGDDAVAGSVVASAATTVQGLIYLQDRLVVNSTTPGNSWTGAGAAVIRGGLMTEGDLSGSGSPQFIYDPAVLRLVQLSVGSFARVPGSWKDF